MNPTNQRVAIAEACGWTDHIEGLYWKNPKGFLDKLPDYLNDLNAMHEAMEVLTGTQYKTFICHLAIMFTDHPDDKYQLAIIATAAQRAEAFLKTLNLWTD